MEDAQIKLSGVDFSSEHYWLNIKENLACILDYRTILWLYFTPYFSVPKQCAEYSTARRYRKLDSRIYLHKRELLSLKRNKYKSLSQFRSGRFHYKRVRLSIIKRSNKSTRPIRCCWDLPASNNCIANCFGTSTPRKPKLTIFDSKQSSHNQRALAQYSCKGFATIKRMLLNMESLHSILRVNPKKIMSCIKSQILPTFAKCMMTKNAMLPIGMFLTPPSHVPVPHSHPMVAASHPQNMCNSHGSLALIVQREPTMVSLSLSFYTNEIKFHCKEQKCRIQPS